MVIVAAVVAAVLVALAVVTVSGARKAPTTGFVPAGHSPGQDAKQITSAFLAAWKSGNLGQAARYTDHPSAAGPALLAYRDHLHLKKLTGATLGATPTSGPAAPREHVTFTVNASVSATAGAKTLTGSWHYHSSLVAYQQRDSKVWYIAWAPDVLAPSLTVTTHLTAVAVPPQTVSVTDSSGNNLASYGDAGLTTIAGVLRKQGPPPGQGSPGLSVETQTTAGMTVASSQAVVIPPDNVPSVATTISARAEAAARRTAAEHKNTSIVAIQPSTARSSPSPTTMDTTTSRSPPRWRRAPRERSSRRPPCSPATSSPRPAMSRALRRTRCRESPTTMTTTRPSPPRPR